MSETLLPCPFCGGAAALHGGNASWSTFVECANGSCSAMPTVNRDTQAEAIAAWNRRAPNPSPPEPSAGWRGIESAPRDGTLLLLATADGDFPLVGAWGGAAPSWVSASDDMAFWPQPSHWMPLPSPPSEAASPASGSSHRLDELLSPSGGEGEEGASNATRARMGPVAHPETDAEPSGQGGPK